MSLTSKIKIVSFNIAASTFYAIVGITCLAALAVIDFRLVHIGVIGILSLVAAYGLFKNKGWSIWAVIPLFFISTTFAIYTLYRTLQKNPIYDLILSVYLLLTWIFTVYTITRK